jgi:holo-[acyl-carrier protein] synthase
VIAGTGIDLCDVERIERAMAEPHGERFRERVFTAGEIAYAESKANKSERYAARFAAKEAGMKALGTGWGDGVSWQDLEVVNLASGRPSLVLHGQAAEVAKSLGVRAISLSLTHTAKQAMALVILES